MYTAEISIDINNCKLDVRFFDLVEELTAALIKSGQVLGNERKNYISDGELKMIVNIPHTEALNTDNHSECVKNICENLEHLTLAPINFTILGTEPTSITENCCGKTTRYILVTNFMSEESPLRCGDCYIPLPLYTIPKIHGEGYNDILAWEVFYKACDTLHQGYDVGKRFGTREISDVKSKLSKKGISLCEKLEQLTHKPTFYYIYNNKKGITKKDQKATCPSCGKKWVLKEKWHNMFDFCCDPCRLLSNTASNT